MYTPSIALALLAISPLVVAHGKVAVITGDAGGNGTALGIMGAVVAGAGSNSKTELDTTVFQGGALGQTTAKGQNQLTTGVKKAMALSGSTLPQVSASNGSLSGTFHVVTSDGCGPVVATIDTSGNGTTASMKAATKATTTTDVPGTKGNCPKSITRRSMKWHERALDTVGLFKRATNVNMDFPIAVAIPAGTTCSGTVAGQSNVCLVKLSNQNAAGPFGGVVAFQMSNGTATAVKRGIQFSV